MARIQTSHGPPPVWMEAGYPEKFFQCQQREPISIQQVYYDQNYLLNHSQT
jgi:hypothetical protein